MMIDGVWRNDTLTIDYGGGHLAVLLAAWVTPCLASDALFLSQQWAATSGNFFSPSPS